MWRNKVRMPPSRHQWHISYNVKLQEAFNWHQWYKERSRRQKRNLISIYDVILVPLASGGSNGTSPAKVRHSFLNVEIIHQKLKWIRCHVAANHTQKGSDRVGKLSPTRFPPGGNNPRMSHSAKRCRQSHRMESSTFFALHHTKSSLPFTHIREVMWPRINLLNIILQKRLCQTHKVRCLFKIIRAIRKNKHLHIESDKYCNLRFYCRPFNPKHCSFMTQQADTSDCSADDQVVIMAVQKLEGCWTICGGVFEKFLWFGGQLSNSHH